MDKSIPLFKNWVPTWLTKIILFSLLLPSLVLFFLPLSNVNAAAGYYGSEPLDIQFSVALFYAGYVGFYMLERRFFNYLATKEYFIIFTFLQILLNLACYHSDNIFIFFPVRFVQGMIFASTVNVSLTLIFTRLHTERAREIGFSVFFGALLCTIPFNNLVTADLIDAYNFNIVYKGAIFSYIPCLIFLQISMNNIRINTKFPLKNVDWQSFLMYSLLLIIIGYVTIYGQEYYWFEDNRMINCLIAFVILLSIFVIRQLCMKRPLIDLSVFKVRNFKVGLSVLFIMYICRFASGLTNSFFSLVLRFDPLHVSYINIYNILGLITGVIISCNLVLQKKSIRFLFVAGFLLLLFFYVRMYFLFDVQADEFNYFIPLFVQGAGVGLIMVPSIIYSISSVPVVAGPSAAAVCLFVRYLGFCVSIALINFFDLFGKGRHYNAFQDKVTVLNPMVKQVLNLQSKNLAYRGFDLSHKVSSSQKMLIENVNRQGQLRFAMDYYEIMGILIVIVLLIIAVFPFINKTAVLLRSRNLSPA